MMRSLPSPWIHSPVLKGQQSPLKSSKAKGHTGGEEDSEQTPTTVTGTDCQGTGSW